MADPTRRDLLKGAAATCVMMALGSRETARADTVREENEKPGTSDWLLSNTRVDPATKYRCPWIEGYCSRTSVRAGETIEFKVSTNPASQVHDRPVSPRLLRRQRGPPPDAAWAARGLAAARSADRRRAAARMPWETAAQLTIPSDWPSGVYLGKLTEQREKLQSYIIFIVRDDRECDFLFQCSDTTWAAYNRWPDLVVALRRRHAAAQLVHRAGRARELRPAVRQVPADLRCAAVARLGRVSAVGISAGLLDGAARLRRVVHLEPRHARRRPKDLLRGKAFLSVGHDEYWSLDMYRPRQGRDRRAACTRRFSAATRSMACSRCCPTRPAFRIARSAASASSAALTPNRERRYAKPWKQHGPDPALLDGRTHDRSGQRRRGLDLREREALAVRGDRHEERRLDQRARRLGASRPSGCNPGTRSARPRPGLPAAAGRRTSSTRRRFTRRRKATWSSTRRRSGGPTA